MLDSARNVMEGSALLIHEAKQALICPGDAESQQRLAQVRPLGSQGRWLFFHNRTMSLQGDDTKLCYLHINHKIFIGILTFFFYF